ncbi:MAG: helix-turn-helix transcriptional regulator [Deltaproteobacteria bacterium]|nr:helix-turn-helix transcriptional regulator [Deltaproteobacteria bacterium]
MKKDLAAELGVNPVQISKVVNKYMVNGHIMRAIAEAIDKDPMEVFMEYYLNPPKRRAELNYRLISVVWFRYFFNILFKRFQTKFSLAGC